MTIQEAIKSGKPFRRTTVKEYPEWNRMAIWYVIEGGGRVCFYDTWNGVKAHTHGQYCAWSLEDILATDYEVKP